jgi:formylglycine-generating enzyme required for sulfatase activity
VNLAIENGAAVSRIFLSHSSENAAEAVALRDWLEREGWKEEIFLDLDPKRGIAAGERWERRLSEAASRCEAVVFLVSRAWIASGWCRRELNLAHRLNKRLFGVLIENLTIAEVPKDLTGEWQIVHLATGRDHVVLRAVLPVTHEESHVTFSAEGLKRLKHGLQQAGLDPKYFAWPPANEPSRQPYRGLRSLEADDAGIFFGRDAPLIEALDQLRRLREAVPPRLLVVLGASGAGKSSFLRAGLIPRLARDDRHFLPLPVIRPGRAVISGENGFVNVLEATFHAAGIGVARAQLREAIAAGATRVRPLLRSLSDKMIAPEHDPHVKLRPPCIVFSIDQGEELFLVEGQDEAQTFLAMLRELLVNDEPELAALFSIRSDSYERLQLAKELEGIHQETLSLPPMPKGSYVEVITGPARRLDGTNHPLKIEDGLVERLLADIDAGGAKDALPLLAFTLERLYVEHGGDGDLTLAEYMKLGGIKGSIEAAVERALKEADSDLNVPKDQLARLALLRRALIPWLAGIDPDTRAPRRRVARLSEIPTVARPLVQHFVEQRLLATDMSKETGEQTIEPVHEALLRQWGLLQGWLAEDAGYLGILEGVKRASRDWYANAKDTGWLTHSTGRLAAVEQLVNDRSDLAEYLEPTEQAYLAACRKRERERNAEARRGKRQAMAALLVGLVVVIISIIWVNRSYWKMRIALLADVWWPSALTVSAERALRPRQTFKECANCPTMVVLPSGEFMMGASAQDHDATEDEGPRRSVRIARPFAVSVFEVTFNEWDACVAHGGCKSQPGDGGWGRGTRPVINVGWNETQEYVTWLSRQTRNSYRLLSEEEWEYGARAGSNTIYSWRDEIGTSNANCSGCGSLWDNKQTAPVGSFSPNLFGLFDMHGNVSEWVQDCYQANYNGAPTDGSAQPGRNCVRRVVRGGSWGNLPSSLRSSSRLGANSSFQFEGYGFRVARDLKQ